jgi:hypothetical protein
MYYLPPWRRKLVVIWIKKIAKQRKKEDTDHLSAM